MKEIGVVVPFLNEEGSLKLVVDSLVHHLINNDISHEIILVNDGSNDKSGQIADEIVSHSDNIRVIHLASPHGIGNAYKLGLNITNTEYFSWLPSDGEIESKVIVDCFKKSKISSNPCISYPVHSLGKRSIFRLILSKIFQKVNQYIFRLNIRYFNGVGVYKSEELKLLKLNSSGFSVNLEIIVKHSRQFKKSFDQVPFHLKSRQSGKEKAINLKNLLDVIKMIISIYKHK